MNLLNAANSTSKKEKLLLWMLLFTWFIVNLLQASYTELANDEAYYWVYSEYLDFGYFDHPPMIALMIKTG